MLLYRTGELSAASCVVIQSEETGSRTVVSANPLEEMSIEEFKDALNSVLLYEQEEEEGRKENQKGEGKGEGEEEVWIHFEGRKPEVLLPCVQWLRNTWGWNGRVRISVECEKPDRVGMKGVAAFADVVVYSRLWAEVRISISPTIPTSTVLTVLSMPSHTISILIPSPIDPANNTQAHYPNTTTTATSPSPSTTPVSAPSFLTSQTPHTSPSATLLCTWGSHGATLLQKRHSEIETLSSVDAWRPSPDHITQGPVDTVGAGDTFMAGLLYALVVRGWDAERGLGFANQIAGRKVLRRGFGGLGVEMLEGGLS